MGEGVGLIHQDQGPLGHGIRGLEAPREFRVGDVEAAPDVALAEGLILPQIHQQHAGALQQFLDLERVQHGPSLPATPGPEPW